MAVTEVRGRGLALMWWYCTVYDWLVVAVRVRVKVLGVVWILATTRWMSIQREREVVGALVGSVHEEKVVFWCRSLLRPAGFRSFRWWVNLNEGWRVSYQPRWL